MIVLIFALAIEKSITGYRLSADDVLFHQTLMDGWTTSWEFIKAVAFAQGRIVHFFDLPFSLLGAYYADNLYFRLAYTALYYFNFVLVGHYVSIISGINFTRLTILILLIFHPIDYYHLPPNSYAFHTTIPIFLITTSRILLLKIRCSKAGGDVLYLLVCFLGMMFSEYGFLYATTLIFCETFARMVSSHAGSHKPFSTFLTALIHRDTLKDFLLIVLFLILYSGFRFIYPSDYEGNQISQQFRGLQFFKTLFGHIYGGTSLSALIRSSGSIIVTLGHFGKIDWIVALSVVSMVFVLANISITQTLSQLRESHTTIRRLLIICFSGIASAVFLTIPIALTGKYQDWCQNINACVFLDSRISYLGVGISLASLFLLLTIWLRSLIRIRYSALIVSLLISFGAGLTWLHNFHVERDMRDYVSAWDRAKILSCLTVEELDNLKLTEEIDPNVRISHHHDFDMDEYWEKYLKDQNAKLNCGNETGKLGDTFPRIALGKRLFTGRSGRGVSLLKQGWSQPELWGTWSNGSVSNIEFPVGTPTPKYIQIEANPLLSSTHPKQDIEVLVNGIPSARIRLTTDSARTFNIPVPSAVLETGTGTQPLQLEFRWPDAASPKQIGRGDDTRQLALGLIALTLR